jgi:hypothetical protein
MHGSQGDTGDAAAAQGERMVYEVKYHIQVEMEQDSGRWFTICTCDMPEACAEVIRVLLVNCIPPVYYRIEIVKS